MYKPAHLLTCLSIRTCTTLTPMTGWLAVTTLSLSLAIPLHPVDGARNKSKMVEKEAQRAIQSRFFGALRK